MRSILAGLRSLTLPWGAGPNTPSIVLGPDVPAELNPDPLGGEVVAAILYRSTNTQRYHFDALSILLGQPYMWRGARNLSALAGDEPVIWWERRRATAIADRAQIEVVAGVSTADAAGLDYRRALLRWRYADLAVGEAGLSPAHTPLSIDGTAAGRGVRAAVASPANSAGIGAVETTVLTLPSTTYYAGQAYELLVGGRYTATIAATYGTWRVRRTSAAGALVSTLGSTYIPSAVSGIPLAERIVITPGGADLTVVLVVTLATSGANLVTHVGSADHPRYVEVRHVGAAADHPHAIPI